MRIRTIKPEFWSNEDLASLDDFTRLLAIGLLNYADDEGYFNAHPDLIRSSLFPLRDESRRIPVSITHLCNAEYIELLDGQKGRTYGRVVNFVSHQVINKPKPSKLKPLCESKQGLLRLQGTDTGLVPACAVKTEQNREDVPASLPVPADKAGPPCGEILKPRVDAPLMRALAALDGADPDKATKWTMGSIAIAVVRLKALAPNVTAADIERRAVNFRKHFPRDATTPNRLVKHWALCDRPPAGS